MTVRRFGSLAVVLLMAGLVFGQGAPKKDPKGPKGPPRPAPDSLEDTLEKALRNSADIKSAEAKVRESEAELNRVRHQVLTRATALYSDLNLARRMVAVAEQTLASQAERHKAGIAGGTDGLLAAQAMVEKHRGEVEKLEAELKSLRGEFAIKGILNLAFDPDGRRIAGTTADGTVRVWDTTSGLLLQDLVGTIQLGAAAPAVQGSMAERVRKWLGREHKADFRGASVATAVETLKEFSGSDVPVRVVLRGRKEGEPGIEMQGTMPIGAWLQVIEDTDLELRIVVRDYGLLVTTKDRVPDGSVRAVDFWKSAEMTPKADPKGPGLEKK